MNTSTENGEGREGIPAQKMEREESEYQHRKWRGKRVNTSTENGEGREGIPAHKMEWEESEYQH